MGSFLASILLVHIPTAPSTTLSANGADDEHVAKQLSIERDLALVGRISAPSSLLFGAAPGWAKLRNSIPRACSASCTLRTLTALLVIVMAIRASIFQVVFTLSPSRVRYLLLIVPQEHGGICVSTVSITGTTVLYSPISAS